MTAALLGLPLLVGTVGLLAMVAAESVGQIAEDRVPLNIAEAAGLANAGDVVRRLRLGEDPARVLPVRPHVISPSIPMATALEAAIWSRRLELVKLFDREGAVIDERSRGELACLAADIDAEDIRQYLTRDGQPACEKNAAMQRVMAR